jgi:hypothetical protein
MLGASSAIERRNVVLMLAGIADRGAGGAYVVERGAMLVAIVVPTSDEVFNAIRTAFAVTASDAFAFI